MTSMRTGRVTEHLGHKNTNYELENYGIKEPAKSTGTSPHPSFTKRLRDATKARSQITEL